VSSYCDIAPGHEFHGPYHDNEYGFPLGEDDQLLERFALEINQAGLSWLLMLKKREGFRRAFRGFAVDRVARFSARDEARLLADEAIIRNKLKVRAVIENAKRIRAMRDSHGSFAAWLAEHHPRRKDDWSKLFKKTFVFTGGEIVNELLMSTGFLPGAHREDCPVYARIAKLDPPWMKAKGFRW
jgi:DNA-3-methyladenine glycosylase I